MKYFTLLLFFSAVFGSKIHAQVLIDTVTTGPSYAQNVWYSLANDNQAQFINTNWDLALATTINPASDLSAALLFNYKIGSLYEIPNSNPSNFAIVDTTGFSTWVSLNNSDTTWGKGAFNNTASIGAFDYGWGTYDFANHSGIQANRVFLIKYTDGSFRKLKIDLTFSTSTYTLTYAQLDNSNLMVADIDFSPYSTKNFVYFSLANGIVDREPTSSSWDLTFLQYPSSDFSPAYPVAGIFHNIGVEVAQVYPVPDVNTFNDWSNASFSNHINTIGYDWKSFAGSWTIADSTVNFVKDKAGDLWKVIFTGFTGSASGQYIFSKEKISTASLNEEDKMQLIVYPNPAHNEVKIVLNEASEGQIKLINSMGQVIEKLNIPATSFGTTSLSVAHLPSGLYHIQYKNENSITQVQLQIIH